MGFRPQRAVALETLDLCAEFRESVVLPGRAIRDSMCRYFDRFAERLSVPPPAILAAIAIAICSGRPHSLRNANPMGDLSDAEYKRRYQLGRRRYLAERAERSARRQAWVRENGPWLLLAVIAVLLVVVLSLTQPHRFIVVTCLALYSGLAWVVCWAVRASC